MIARILPAKVRAVIYTVIGVAQVLELIWDLVPDPIEGKVLATISALGFGLALTQTPIKEN